MSNRDYLALFLSAIAAITIANVATLILVAAFVNIHHLGGF